MNRAATSVLLLLIAASSLFAADGAPAPPPATNATDVSWTTGAYSYDGAGNITSIGPGTGSVTQTYQYDAVGRLATGTANTTAQNNAQTYRYDRYGNLTEIVTTAGAVAPATAKLAVDPTSNQITTVSDCDPHGPPCYTATYDQAGNVLTSSAGSLHTWDDLGMMTRFQGGTRDELYVYDASNERVAVVRLAPNGAESTREYALRGLDGKVLREVVRDAATPLELHWKRDNIFNGSSLIASIVDDGTGTPKRCHHHADHLGTPRLITDDAGFVLARHTYWPYGEDAPTTEIGSERMKFTAHERDLDTTPGRELDYMHARFYSPSRGRFLSVDPKTGYVRRKLPQGWNRYAYAMNNPVKFIDPDGEETRLAVGGQTNQNPVGHLAIIVNDKVYSYGTNWSNRGANQQDWGASSQVYLDAQSGHRQTQLMTLNITPEQEQKLQQHLDANNPNAPGAPKYNEIANSRVMVTYNALTQTGTLPNVPIQQPSGMLVISHVGAILPAEAVNNVQQTGIVRNTQTVGTEPKDGFWRSVWNAVTERL